MKLDASQLENVNAAVSNDGRLCQFTLVNRKGEQLQFMLSYRQISLFASNIQAAAGDMRQKLINNNEASAAEMLTALTEPYPVKSIVSAEATDKNSILWVEFEGGGAISISMDQNVASQLLMQLLAQHQESREH